MESENNATLIDTLSLILAMFQLLKFVVSDKDCDIAVETLRTCLVSLSKLAHWSCTQCQNNGHIYTIAD